MPIFGFSLFGETADILRKIADIFKKLQIYSINLQINCCEVYIFPKLADIRACPYIFPTPDSLFSFCIDSANAIMV